MKNAILLKNTCLWLNRHIFSQIRVSLKVEDIIRKPTTSVCMKTFTKHNLTAIWLRNRAPDFIFLFLKHVLLAVKATSAKTIENDG